MSGSVTEILAIATVLLQLVLIGIVVLQRSAMKGIVEGIEKLSRRKPSDVSMGNDKALLPEIGKSLLKTNSDIARFEIVLSGILNQLETIKNGLQDLREVRTGTSEGPLPAVPVAPSAQEQPNWAATLPELEPQVNPEPRAAVGVSVLDNYRKLIAEPRKAEINRWADDCGGISCAVNEDGSISALPREAGGVLVIVSDADGALLLLPGGRMVVEFATSFANMMSMRSVTRDCYELSGDGSGLLRLLEPARVSGGSGFWSLVSPGKLSGFTG